MKAPFRKIATLLCFLVVLGALVASGSGALDIWILSLIWGAFLIGSIALLIKSARQPPGSRGFYCGQVALLPRRWQRWVLGEEGPPQKEERRPASN